MGSSPRVRGSLFAHEERVARDGIIPAGAGLTLRQFTDSQEIRDHPRGCGAHSYPPQFSDSEPGIIPAGAGLTDCQLSRASGLRDHPRGCGAHFFLKFFFRVNRGSSPRVRGSRENFFKKRLALGIIPAGAGLTLKNPNSYAISQSFGSQNHSLLSILTGYCISFIRLSQLRLNTLSVFAMTLQTPAILSLVAGSNQIMFLT